jgi:general stress protein YciG
MATDRDRSGSSRSGGKQGGGTSNRGFASMDKEKQREIARKGGEHSHDNDSKGGRSDRNR